MATSPNATPTPITPPRVPFLDPRTGLIDRAWYQFLLSLFRSAEIVDGSSVAPQAQDISGELDNLRSELEIGTQPRQELGTMAPMNKQFMDYIGWNQNAGVAVLPGQMAWNSGDGCLDIGMGYDGVVLQTGLESLYRIKASATINNGDLVQFDGAVGASGVIKGKPSATGLAEGLYIMGVATMDIPNNDFGYVTAFGLVRGINTTGSSVGETWADGDILYYNPAYTGGMTNVRPTSPAEVVVVAAVVNAGPGGSGSLFIRPSFYPKLTELSNVYSPSPVNGNLIIYNQSTARWENATLTPGNGIAVTNGAGAITLANNIVAGTNISITGTNPLTISASFSTTGATGSVTLAEITPGGTQGSLTFANGLITAFVAPT